MPTQELPPQAAFPSNTAATVAASTPAPTELTDYTPGVAVQSLELSRQTAAYLHFSFVLQQIDDPGMGKTTSGRRMPFVAVRFPYEDSQTNETKLDMGTFDNDTLILFRPLFALLVEQAAAGILAAWTNLESLLEVARPHLEANRNG